MAQSTINRSWTFVIIWIVHIIIYYFIWGNIDNLMHNYYSKWDFFFDESVSRSLSSPIVGLLGFYDGFPFFVVVPILAMLVLISTLMKTRWQLAYFISCIGCYLGMYLYNAYIDKNTNLYQSGIGELSLNHIFLIIPALTVTMLINWVVFKNKYQLIKTI